MANAGRWTAGLAVLALAAGGCALGTGDDRRRAEELAAKQFPGQLTVVTARNLFPETSGSEVVFALSGDPDTVVRLRVDAEAGTCERQPCERKLAEAVDKGRSLGTAWRHLATAFQRCGHPIIAANWPLNEVWIEAAPTNANVRALLADVGECVQEWAKVRDGRGGLSVNLVEPAVAGKRPRGEPGQPTLLRMTESKLLAALSEKSRFIAGYAVPEDPSEPPEATARIFRPFAERQAFDKKVQDAVAGWLRANRPGASVGRVVGVWRLVPGTVDRQSGHVLFCEGQPEGEVCHGDQVVAVTVDPQGNPVGRLQVIENVRDEKGTLRLPDDADGEQGTG
ncbi:lipoprotein [Nonomuraea recticatena]|uniref:Lipoprotein n=1 Tax=Nonomuraea recticatena TaxID=46178 RepID=A0ABN3RA04_9ACTN